MNEFPKMMYRAGGTEEIHGGKFSTHIVHNEAEQKAALADGWHLTTPEAKEAAELQSGAGSAGDTGLAGGAGDDAPPTRDELKHKATELGLTFPGNISNAKLAEMIAEALADDDKPKD